MVVLGHFSLYRNNEKKQLYTDKKFTVDEIKDSSKDVRMNI